MNSVSNSVEDYLNKLNPDELSQSRREAKTPYGFQVFDQLLEAVDACHILKSV